METPPTETASQEPAIDQNGMIVTREKAAEIVQGVVDTARDIARLPQLAIDWPLDREATLELLRVPCGYHVTPEMLDRWTESFELKPRDVDDEDGETWFAENLLQAISLAESRRLWLRYTPIHARKKTRARVVRENWQVKGDREIEAMLPLFSLGDLLLHLLGESGSPTDKERCYEHIVAKLLTLGIDPVELDLEPVKK